MCRFILALAAAFSASQARASVVYSVFDQPNGNGKLVFSFDTPALLTAPLTFSDFNFASAPPEIADFMGQQALSTINGTSGTLTTTSDTITFTSLTPTIYPFPNGDWEIGLQSGLPTKFGVFPVGSVEVVTFGFFGGAQSIDDFYSTTNGSVEVVPEPASLALFAIGVIALRWRKWSAK